MPVYPIAYVGQPVTADFWNSGQWNYTYKPADTGITSDATINADPDLSGIALPVGVHHVQVQLFAFLATNATGVDIKVAWSFSGTATGNRSVLAAATTSTSRSDTTMTAAGIGLTTEAGTGLSTTSSATIFEESIVTVTVAGNLAINWAQVVSTANQLSVGTNSYLRWKQIG